MNKRLVILVVGFLVIAVNEARTRHHGHVRKHEISRPNIVFILTDDQDVQLGGMTPLVKTKKLIASHGITFTNAFASTPICCPSRSTILTGRYQHNHGVLNNSVPGNCNGRNWQRGPEQDTFAVHLKQANYTTAYLGKYLNQYGNIKTGGPEHVPPGWDHWTALVGNSKYYNYTLSKNGVVEFHQDDPKEDYFTDLITKRAMNFLRNYNVTSGPFFMMLSPPTCHAPFTPHPRYHRYFSELKAPRTPNFNISNREDKHWLLRHAPEFLSDDLVDYIDETFRNRWRTLLSVDDMVEKIVETLQEKNVLDNTYIIFTSDHGYHLGQFSLPIDKRQAYEFDVRIPLMIRGPGIPAGQERKELIVTIDFAPTFVHMAGLSHPSNMDGKSIVPLLYSDDHAWRSEFLIEYHGEGYYNTAVPSCPNLDYSGMANCFPGCICEDALNNTYTCLRTLNKTLDTVYCQFDDKERFVEMFNLTSDPYQLYNLAYDASPPTDDGEAVRPDLMRAMERMKKCHGIACFET